jgi:hypothetical protein
MAERKLDKEVDDIMAEWGAPGIKKGGRGHKRRHGSLARCKAIR